MTETAARHRDRSTPEAEIVAALGRRAVVLVGMMGSGKSTIGRRLGVRLHIPFLDADHEIEVAHAGMTVSEIFAQHGEPYFRDGEARVIARLLESGPCVIATGGGAFMREETRERIRARGISVWLQADGDVILRRIKRRSDRPLLQTADPAATIARLIAERSPVYRLADIAIASRDVPHEKVVEECVEAIHAYLVSGVAATPSPASDIR
jgi:shikimate kinase